MLYKMKYQCRRCGYNTYRLGDIRKHYTKRKERCSPVLDDVNANLENIIKLPSDKFKCKFCEKEYSSSSNLNRHHKSCKTEIADLTAKVAELQYKLEEEKKKPPQTVINNYIQVNINGYRDTTFEHLSDRQYQKAVRRMVYSVPQMIQDVHFNPKVPENHNIYISNIKNKYAMVYDGKKWCSKPQDMVIDQLINDQEYAIEEWLGEGEKFPKEMEKFNDYLEKKESSDGDDIKNIIKEEVKLLLYNNRGVIKNR